MTTPEYIPQYVPILKGKAGELEALRLAQQRTRNAMVPLIEAIPKDDGYDQAANLKGCKQLITKLAKGYRDRVMLDGGLFPEIDADIGSHRGVIGTLADLSRDEGVISQPVIRIGDPPRALAEAGQALRDDGHGLTVRLSNEDVDEDPEDLDDQLVALLCALGATAEQVDLIIDLAAVEGDALVRGGARVVRSVVRDVPTVEDCRSVTVASGAFPVDLAQFEPYIIGERARYDAQLFDQVRRRKLPRDLDYGDYAVAHPELTIGLAFSPPPQLRYTTAENWMVLKGRKNDPRGNEQFQDICRAIAAHPDFTGTPTGAADVRIAAGSPEGPGNGTTWRTVGTTHHLDYVALRLTTLGEP